MEKNIDYRKLTSPCGIDCFNCEIYETNVTPELQQRIGAMRKVKPETVLCGGCRVTGCFVIPGECKARKCVEEKGVEFCHECGDFPCNRLHPSLNGAERYPQNYKLFNLCRIKKVGLEKWAEEEAAEIRRRYKEGIIEIGNGPQLN